MRKSRKVILSIVCTSLLYSLQSAAQGWNGVAKDAWIDVNIESSYLINAELNSLKIETYVEKGKVMLAGVIAKSIDVVKVVDNRL